MTGKQIFVRSWLTLALPLILIWVFVSELWHGLRSAFRGACLEVRVNLTAYRHEMQRDD